MRGRRPLVLCIDTDSGTSPRKVLLERHGYEVVAAATGGEGFSVVKKNPVDAVVIDLEVPGTSGATVVRRMKEIKAHVPVLLLSASAKNSPGKFPGGDAVVLKSDAPVRLVQVLDHLLKVRFPFFTRWFGNWKHRAGA